MFGNCCVLVLVLFFYGFGLDSYLAFAPQLVLVDLCV